MSRRYRTALVAFGIMALIALYVAGVGHNPTGFYLDESSIAYNAFKISQTGRDEFGASWPLYFRAFGEYKNPSYIYLLALLYRLTGPSILVARLLSASLGLMFALLLGILAGRMTRRRNVGLMVGIFALFTPWFFELSRLVLEVALYPAALALFLLALHRASGKPKWSQLDIAGLALGLGLLTYSYTAGRLLAPLLAAGLIFFVTRERTAAIIQTWLLYATTLVPLLVFNHRNPGALLTKFRWATYITSESAPAKIGAEFIKHYVNNLNPWNLFVTGDANQVIHIPSLGSLLLVQAFLIAAGIMLVLRHHRRDAWWRFILYGVAVSIVPASLTRDEYPSLRLIAFPVFLLILSVPAFAWLTEASASKTRRQVVLAFVLIAAGLQGALFQYQFHRVYRYSTKRLTLFDAGYPDLLNAVLATQTPIYLVDRPSLPGYIQAYWYGALRGLNESQLVHLQDAKDAPKGALVITTEENRSASNIIAKCEPYTAYIADGGN